MNKLETSLERHATDVDHSTHAIGHVLNPANHRLANRLIRVLCCVLVVIYALRSASLIVQNTTRTGFSDLTQEYLMARALLGGASPYDPQIDLARRFAPELARLAASTPALTLSHPTPHPPAAGLVVAPLGLLGFQEARAVWLGLQLLCLALIARWLAGRSRFWPLVLAALIAWPPAMVDLNYGQLTTFVATLAFGAWVSNRRGDARLAGICIGLAAAVKLYPAALLAYWVIRREWRAVAYGCGTALGLTLAAVALIGRDATVSYLSTGLPAVNIYLGAEGNASLVGAVTRTFAGNGAIAPLIDAPALVAPVSAVLGVVLVALTGRAIARAPTPEQGYVLAICCVLLVTPVVWLHYFLLLVWPIRVIVLRLVRRGWPPHPTNAALLAVLLVSVEPLIWARLLDLALPSAVGQHDALLSPLAGLPFLAPTLGTAVLWLILRHSAALDRRIRVKYPTGD